MKKAISFLLATVMVMGALPVVSIAEETTDIDDGLILYYSFDTDIEYPDTITDASGNGNDAKVLNTFTGDMTKELSVVNGVACFPGYGYIGETLVKGAALQLPNNVNVGIETFTYSAWVKSSWTNEGNVRLFDFGNLGTSRSNAYNSIFTKVSIDSLSSGTSTIRIHDRSLASDGENPIAFVEASSVKAFNNTWSLYTLVYEKNEATGYYEATVYIDGSKKSSLCATEKFTRSLGDLGTLNNTSNGMFIGRSVWTAIDKYAHENPDFRGQMDEIRLYDRALGEDEVKYLYNNTKPGYTDFITGFDVPVIEAYVGDEITLPKTITYNTAFSDTELYAVSWFKTGEDITDSVGTYKIEGSTDIGDVFAVINVSKKNTASGDGLLLYYNFDTDSEYPSTITDVSGNGNDATVLNNTSSSPKRYLTVSNGTAKFPGMASSALGAALKLPNTINQGVTTFTYSAWIKADSSYEHAGKMTRFFDFGNISGGPRDSIFARYTSSSGNMFIQDRGIQKSKETTLSDKPFTDTWGLFTLVYEKSASTNYYELTVYVNGEEVSALNSTTQFTRGLSDLGTLTDSSNGFFIGRTVWCATGSFMTDNPDFCGEMDEIRLYTRALTQAEIKELYNTTNPERELEAVDYSVEDVTTNAGDYPNLPDYVTVIYNNGDEKTESVVWDMVSSEEYSQAGSFEVAGVTQSGMAVSVRVVVIKVDTSSTLSEGLVVYYSFDNDSAEPDEIIDVSGNGNDATVLKNVQTVAISGSDSATAEVNNIITVEDGVAIFPGYSQLQVSSSQTRTFMGAALKMPNNVNSGIENFTYSAWIQADSGYKYASELQRFFDFGNLSNNYNSIFYRYTPATGDSRLQDRYVGSSSNDAASYVGATLSDKPFNDAWAHLLVTYEKQAGGYYIPTIYINGEERAEYNKTIKTLTRSLKDLGTLTDDTNGLLIGRTIWAANNSNVTTNPDFCGKMDEIRLYDRVLTESEIQQLYAVYKPSDVAMELDEYRIPITEDVEVTRKAAATNMNGSSFITVASTGYDSYSHFALMRTDELTEAQKLSVQNSEQIILSAYVITPLGTGAGDYYCYGLSGDHNLWDVNSVTYGNYVEHIYGSVADDGTAYAGELIDTYSTEGSIESFYIQFDVTDFVKENPEDFSFLITTNSGDGICLAASELGEYEPELILSVRGVPVTVNRVDENKNLISSSVVFANMGKAYTYTVADALISYKGAVYVLDGEASKLTINSVTGEDVIEVVYTPAGDVAVSVEDIYTYVGKAPLLPSVVTVKCGGYSASFAADWEDIAEESYAEKGEFTAEGVVADTSVPVSATVKVFPEYNGAAGGDLTLSIYADGELYEEKAIEGAYGDTFTLDKSYEGYLGNCYRLESVTGDITAIGEKIVMNQLGQRVNLYFVMTEEIRGVLSVKIKADNAEETSHTLIIRATVINTKTEDEKVSLVIADYNGDVLESAETLSEVIKSRTGEYITLEKSVTYSESRDKDKVVYLWSEAMEPLAEAVALADVEIEGYLPEAVEAMLPTYDSAVAAIRSANDYWQDKYAYNQSVNGLHVAFWDTAAYHTGNVEAYKLTGDEDYLQYSVNWANYCNWTGNNYAGDPSTWTWTYDQNQGSTGVLFGDWQTCFQSYIDMYELGVEDASLERVYEVVDYQISKDEDGYWWWADALYMVMPVMSKLYKQTGDEKYLDALYKYFRYAKELMYDGKGGIPTDKNGYTTSAELKSGAGYSDPEDYKNLFYRDANYVYPLRPNSGHETEKNFWARGNGWVFAGLSKVLSDMPETYEHYDEFCNTYVEMAEAIVSCQQTDDNGYGFWTQSMLQNYPAGNNGNAEGYETSGSAFFTYGLFWGINSGILDKDTYLESAARAWGYLENVALQPGGKVGYVQPIGSNATSATPYSTTNNFGVGAFLLAACEAARYAENQ